MATDLDIVPVFTLKRVLSALFESFLALREPLIPAVGKPMNPKYARDLSWMGISLPDGHVGGRDDEGSKSIPSIRMVSPSCGLIPMGLAQGFGGLFSIYYFPNRQDLCRNCRFRSELHWPTAKLGAPSIGSRRALAFSDHVKTYAHVIPTLKLGRHFRWRKCCPLVWPSRQTS